MLEQSNFLMDEKKYEIAASDYFVKALRLIISTDTSKKKATVLNLRVFRQLCVFAAQCLKEFGEIGLARQYATRALQTVSEVMLHVLFIFLIGR